MELFAVYLNLLLFYIELFFGFRVTWILKKENPKIESFLPSADLASGNIRIYIYKASVHKIVISAVLKWFLFTLLAMSWFITNQSCLLYSKVWSKI